MTARVAALSRAPGHGFSKTPVRTASLIAGLGVEGDAHAGATVRHRSRVARDPTQPNLRQVHLLPAELLADLAAEGFDIAPGALGENVLTRGVDLHALPAGARLTLGETALIEITGLRDPCHQIDDFRKGLQRRLLRDDDGEILRRGGVMAVVLAGGPVRAGDPIAVALPPPPHRPLEVV